MKADKVDYIAESNAVYQIAYDSTQNQGERYRTQSIYRREVVEKYQDSDGSNYAQSAEKNGVVIKQAENSAGIPNVIKVEKSGDQHYLWPTGIDP